MLWKVAASIPSRDSAVGLPRPWDGRQHKPALRHGAVSTLDWRVRADEGRYWVTGSWSGSTGGRKLPLDLVPLMSDVLMP